MELASCLKDTAVMAVGKLAERLLRKLWEENKPNKTGCLGSDKKEDAEGKYSLVTMTSVSDIDNRSVKK